MKKSATLLAALAVAFAVHGATRMASEAFVTNRIAVAVVDLSTTLAAVATSGKYSGLSGKPPTIYSYNTDAADLSAEIAPTEDLETK